MDNYNYKTNLIDSDAKKDYYHTSSDQSQTNLKTLINNPVKALLQKNDFNNQYMSASSSSKPPHSTFKSPKVNFEFKHTLKEATRNKDKENHLGSSSEASTQTSFVESSSTGSSVAGSLSSGEIKRQQQTQAHHHHHHSDCDREAATKQRLKKEKLQQIIQLQKQQHEKRVKALEKLAQLERMHAEKLRKIMLTSQNDSISSLIYDSFFQTQETQSLINNDTTTFDLDQLEREIKEQEYKLLKSDKNNKFMYKTLGESSSLATANKRQSCMNFNEFKSTSQFQKYANEEVTRRNSEFYTKSNVEANKRFSDLKNFTKDIPSFEQHKKNKTETPSSSVEILNLKNTTVLENQRPEGSRFLFIF